MGGKGKKKKAAAAALEMRARAAADAGSSEAENPPLAGSAKNSSSSDVATATAVTSMRAAGTSEGPALVTPQPQVQPPLQVGNYVISFSVEALPDGRFITKAIVTPPAKDLGESRKLNDTLAEQLVSARLNLNTANVNLFQLQAEQARLVGANKELNEKYIKVLEERDGLQQRVKMLEGVIDELKR